MARVCWLVLRGDGAWVEGTLIDNFGGDGIRGLGSNSTYVWNTVRDAPQHRIELGYDIDHPLLEETALNGDGIYLSVRDAAELWASLEVIMVNDGII